ncbi:MAG: helix-turn-helix domain-containing protein [Bacteroidales bacterium]|nr:helix-turn-helix domain-containing protein [Bacteroidales bacterium]
MGANDYLLKPFDIKVLKSKINSIFENRQKLRVYLYNKLAMDSSARQIDVVDNRQDFINKAVQTVENNLDNMEFNPDDFAKEMGLSRVQLYRKFNILLNQHVMDFVKQVRLAKAARLLISTDMTISQIAYGTGLSPKHFAALFKGTYGMTPTTFRQNNKAV